MGRPSVVVGAAWIVSICFAVGVAASPVASAWPQFAAACALGAVSLALATLTAVRAPGHPMAGWLSLPGAGMVLTTTVDGSRLGPFEGSWVLLYLPFAILLLVVPTGRPAGPRWRLTGWAITVDAGLFMAVVAAQRRWSGPVGPAMAAAAVLLAGFLILLVACAAAPIIRYRHSDEQQRSRLRWVFLAGVSLPLTLLLCWTSYLLLGTADLVVIGLTVMYLAIPSGVTVAVLRPQLFDVDHAAVATVTATLLSAVGLLILSIVSGAVGLRMVQWSPVAALSSTAGLAAAAALAFRPLRRILDGMLYPERERAVSALRELARRVDAGRARPEEVESALREVTHDPGLVVGYRGVSDDQM